MARKSIERMTNHEFMKDLMDEGPMVQAFVIDALGKWADIVVKKGLDGLRKEFGANSFINADTWFYAAKKVQERLNEKYKG